jgi:SET domain-containing protein
VKNSKIHGKGIFISKRILKGKKIMDIKGEVIDGDECERREDEEDNVYIFWNGDDCYIDTAKTKKIKYINHNCDFNCDVVENEENGLMLIAYRTIEPGEELTIDYGYEDIYEDCECQSCIEEESP